ncbi:hypothetical protein GM415_01810 [Pseudodesulfovibrio cashew]|uniref:Calcium-binding protein n=1 Tax=Pseudodesulfovibrio cashew TaxID=2678688 RepID=A0A6I6JE64_9BACT|nr:hypothetical protein [Pseudodesulfovibrio cashew]QGY38923.1 hypothetical protein GM415_01810 [Pseudodesulfovibrio cashew]
MQNNTESNREVRITVQAGDAQLVDIPADATLVFDFDPAIMTFTMNGGDLVITSQDSGATILHDYAASVVGSDAPEILFAEGNVIAGDVFLDLLHGGQFEMATAASGSSFGSGAGEYSDQAGHFVGAGGDFGALSGGDEHAGFGGGGFDGGAHQDSPDHLLFSTGATPVSGGNPEPSAPYEMVTFEGYETSDGVFKIGPYGIIVGSEGDDTIVGADGFQSLSARGGNDILVGTENNDMLIAGDGSDLLWGGAGDDQLDGGAGNDILYASTGHDYVTFGSGEDTLIVQENALGSGSYIEVKDYDIGIDIIDLRGDLDITGVTKTAAGDYEFTATGSTGDTSTIHLAGVDAADYSAHIAGIDASPDDLIQYMIDHSQALA